MKWWAWAAAGFAAGSAIVACAVGTEVAPDDGQSGTADDGGTGTEASPPARYDAGTSPGVDAAAPGDDAAAADDAGATNDAGGTMDGGVAGIPCDPATTCQGATSFGNIAGDTGGTASTSGEISTWLTLDVVENDSGAFADGMKLSVTLSSPPGENFDLFVYLPGSPGTRECASVTKSSTNGAGQTDSVKLTWGESGTFANGSDDSRTVTIEVRAAAGNTCQSGATWSLTAVGG